MNAVAKKAMAARASETAFSQINSGCHSRHAPCGLSIDMSRLSPKKQHGLYCNSIGRPGWRSNVHTRCTCVKRASAPGSYGNPGSLAPLGADGLQNEGVAVLVRNSSALVDLLPNSRRQRDPYHPRQVGAEIGFRQ